MIKLSFATALLLVPANLLLDSAGRRGAVVLVPSNRSTPRRRRRRDGGGEWPSSPSPATSRYGPPRTTSASDGGGLISRFEVALLNDLGRTPFVPLILEGGRLLCREGHRRQYSRFRTRAFVQMARMGLSRSPSHAPPHPPPPREEEDAEGGGMVSGIFPLLSTRCRYS